MKKYKLFQDVPSVLFDQDEFTGKNTQEYILKYGCMPALLHISDQEKCVG